MQDLLRRMVERKGSDLFITAGFPPAIKIDGEIRPQTNVPLTPEQSSTPRTRPPSTRILRTRDRRRICPPCRRSALTSARGRRLAPPRG